MEFSIRNRKVWFVFLLLCIALFLLSGCEMKKMGGDAASKESYVVTDAFDNQVTIPHKPKKILGTDSAIDTMLLGVVEPSRLAACFIADKDPGMSYIADEVKDIKPEIPLNGISMEILTKISPDLIVASSYTRQKELDMWRSLGCRHDRRPDVHRPGRKGYTHQRGCRGGNGAGRKGGRRNGTAVKRGGQYTFCKESSAPDRTSCFPNEPLRRTGFHVP